MRRPGLALRGGAVVVAAACGWLAPAARADCFDEAAAYQHVNATVLRAIAWQESRGRADALHHNANGSLDYGLMQINSAHKAELQRWGIAPEQLMEPCVGVYVAAWHLRKMMLKYGNTWDAVGAYHSETPALRDSYKAAIQRIVAAHAGPP
ncbi:lysozyme-related protein Hpa2 [Duganella sp. SG902]|uniref:lytic transglycosylase domain-containing protein n=1 Tax=Duganella sp. SG902 TaxID=2587016 RepID=UPI00159E5115|nr:lytic transglycosylase domain-containing protein [Duganella sp. SG902]NVM77654.1 lysozyme-related protein Hpa2 [Duganella sp. SG902]